ncbi:peptidyl-prolyl cis-trans isomerase [Algisphaera agarilytica]|uniref:Parvulin-like peptidyl-prolyl isomerase n=1 Tax=Algisphaera agarilytica TaxID=1385975 RepID=A0A7X0H5I1_9BACT|nr:peptidylprolyl isomerase [Algisphaera agarilytica]MBB6429442.1 parvulin-like peptidyl-prolyl isomerase [Algisphaera agarilytica]
MLSIALNPRAWRWAVLAGVCSIVLGCQSKNPETPRVPDIVRTEPAPAARESLTEVDEPQADEEPIPPVEAMVGQIAGQPIYAHHVLSGMEEQLASLGRRLPARSFRDQATALIFEQVRGLVQDALIQDEANRSLSPAQRGGLELFVASRREELMRRYGQGSLALAERQILEQTGKTLQENLRDIRTQITISTYLERNLRPLINVTRRDIERFYRDNYETFNPPPKREVNLIYSASPPDSEWFTEQLEAGVPFSELALDDRNAFRGGDMKLALEGDDMFEANINEAIQPLEAGEWVGPLPNRGQDWFIYIASLDRPETRTLFEAQVDIERALRTQQERQLQLELGEKLRRGASFTDEQRMTEAVLEIAVARYASQ